MKKQVYESPQLEAMELKTEGCILSLSDGFLTESVISANAMTEDAATFATWDTLY